jgi:hypothetical protein
MHSQVESILTEQNIPAPPKLGSLIHFQHDNGFLVCVGDEFVPVRPVDGSIRATSFSKFFSTWLAHEVTNC